MYPSRFETVAACFSWVVLVLGSCAGPPRPSRIEIVVLGVAQDGGLPHVGCSKPCCVSARGSGRTLHPASLGIVNHEAGQLCLVEATPGIEPQLALLHRTAGQPARGRKPVDAVLLTHAHLGHYFGLAHFGTEVASTHEIPVWVSRRFGGYLMRDRPWRLMLQQRQITLRELEPGTSFSPIEGVTVRATPVPHRDEISDTMAFTIRGPNRTVLFVPDIDSWARQPGLLEKLVEGVDVAYLDATFFDGSELPDRAIESVRHPFITETMEALADAARRHPGRFRFIHLNHTNPALHDAAVRRRIEAAGFRIAEQGERVAL